MTQYTSLFSPRILWPTVAVGLILLTLTPVKAQTPPPVLDLSNTVHVLTEREIVIRSGPGLDYTRIGRVDAEEEITLTGQNTGSMSWLRLKRSGREGWIAGYTLPLDTDLSELSQARPRNAISITRPVKHQTVLALRTVNVRAEPSNQSELITQLKDGDEVVVLGRSDERTSWLRLDLEGIEGWVAYFTVTLNGQADELPILDQATGIDADLLNDVPNGSVTAQIFRAINVRSGPGMEYDPIGQLHEGDVVSVTGRSDTGNNWLLIEFEDSEGWVAYFTVSVSGNPNELPLVVVEEAE